MTDGNDYDGSLLDKKPNGPFYHLSQSDINKQPVVVANGHAGKAYFSFDADECLNDDYNLNNKEYISVFIVCSLHDHPTLGEMRMVVMISILLLNIYPQYLENYS